MRRPKPRPKNQTSGEQAVKAQKPAIPPWILELAKEFENGGVMLEETIKESRRLSRKLKTSLSEEVIAEREEHR